MTRLAYALLGALLSLGGVSAPRLRAAAPADPSFQEIYEVLRSHLAGLDEAELNRAAVEGLLARLRGRALFATNPAQAQAEPTGPILAKATVYDDAYAYMRFSRVDAGAAADFDKTLRGLASSNKLKGLVLDLRFADGQDYAAAAAVADRFLASERPLLDWGSGLVRSTDKTNAVRMPVAVLMNRQTTGSAETLAAVLQKSEVALLVGANTTGAAGIMKDFKLKNGQTLRVATALIKLGQGETLSAKGLVADIPVSLPPEEERRFLDDPYRNPQKPTLSAAGPGTNSLAGTNRAGRVNEAELVRRMKDGMNPDSELAMLLSSLRDSERPALRDPALVRALDLLKGLAVVYGRRP